jgi:hypothetical protein
MLTELDFFFSCFPAEGLKEPGLMAMGRPHLRQVGAASLTSVPQSGQLIKAIPFHPLLDGAMATNQLT